MLSRTIDRDGVKLVITRPTPLARLMRLCYERQFREINPELGPFFDALGAGTLQALLEAAEPSVRELVYLTLDFITTASLVASAAGLPFEWPKPGESPSRDKVQSMFGHFLVHSELWAKAKLTRQELTAPLSAPAEQPPEIVGSVQAQPEGSKVPEIADPNLSQPA